METIKIIKGDKVLEVTERIFKMVYLPIGYEIVNDDEENEENEEVEENLEDLTVVELKELAKASDLEGYSDLKKAELIELLKEN